MKITVKNLTKSYGSNTLFSDFNMSFEENKLNCIYGTSGCGKTTLINIIGLIEPFQKGDIYYDDKTIRNNSDKRKMLKNNIGFIFQDFGLIPNATVLENMNMVYKIQRMKDKKEQISKVMEQLNLIEMLNRKVYELSGGEQQRVAIAKIMLKNPEVILADEPTASLDDENKILVLDTLRELSKTKTVIIVSHDKTIIDFCDVSYDLSEIKHEK